MGDFNDAIDGETIVDLIRKNFNQEAFGRLTCKRWKDGIDIDHPTFAIEQFVRDIRALTRPEPDRSEVRELTVAILHAENLLSEHIEEFHDFDYQPHQVPLELAQLRSIQHHLKGSLIGPDGKPILSAGLVPDEAAIRNGGQK